MSAQVMLARAERQVGAFWCAYFWTSLFSQSLSAVLGNGLLCSLAVHGICSGFVGSARPGAAYFLLHTQGARSIPEIASLWRSRASQDLSQTEKGLSFCPRRALRDTYTW
jgi:hypothetical protein